MCAMHKVKASQPVFSTAMTLPAGVRNLYVQTTLPDGTVSVSMQPVSAALNVAGAVMKSAEAPKIRTSAATRSESSSMPDYPTLPVKTESDFAEGAVIRQTPAGNIDLGASWIAKPYAAAAEYYIPAGAEITGNINLNGKFSPHSAPVLYVAGKLTLNASVTIGQATLAVLPGGKVYIKEAKANLQQNAVNPAIYVFEGGTFTTDKTSLFLARPSSTKARSLSTDCSTSTPLASSTTERRPHCRRVKSKSPTRRSSTTTARSKVLISGSIPTPSFTTARTARLPSTGPST